MPASVAGNVKQLSFLQEMLKAPLVLNVFLCSVKAEYRTVL